LFLYTINGGQIKPSIDLVGPCSEGWISNSQFDLSLVFPSKLQKA
jgi:hypothetical protein